MKIAIIGAGDIARKTYFRFLFTWPGVDITHVYSRTQKTIDAIHGEWGITCGTTDLGSLIASRPEGAIIITPTVTHYEIIKTMLENGIDVYSEKSLTAASEQSYELAELAKERQRILVVGFNRRYSPLFMQAKQIFSSRRIQLALIQKHRQGNGPSSMEKFFLDDIIHQLDLARYYCGDLKPVSTTYTTENEAITGVVCHMEIQDGGQCLIAVARQAGAWQESVSLHGEGSSVHVDAFERLIIRNSDHEVVYGTDLPGSYTPDMVVRGFMGEIEHFFECIKTRQTPRTNAFEAAETQRLMETMLSIRTKSG